jgi:hypothetical protein
LLPKANRNHTRGRLHKDEFYLDDVGPTHTRHCADHERRAGGPVPYKMLSRLLNTAVGQLWKTTHRKLSETFDRRTEVGALTWHYINQEVDDNAFVDGDGVYLSGARSWRHQFFVHPQTGVLHVMPRKRYRYHKPVNADELKLDEFHTLNREAGIWFLYTYHLVKEEHTRRVTRTRTQHDDVCPLNGWPTDVCAAVCSCVPLYETYYTEHKAQKNKQQLNSKELKRFGLMNTPQPTKLSRREKRRKAA